MNVNSPEFLKRESATIALLAILSNLKVVSYDQDCLDFGNVIFVSLNEIHKFIRRQVEYHREQ